MQANSLSAWNCNLTLLHTRAARMRWAKANLQTLHGSRPITHAINCCTSIFFPYVEYVWIHECIINAPERVLWLECTYAKRRRRLRCVIYMYLNGCCVCTEKTHINVVYEGPVGSPSVGSNAFTVYFNDLPSRVRVHPTKHVLWVKLLDNCSMSLCVILLVIWRNNLIDFGSIRANV